MCRKTEPASYGPREGAERTQDRQAVKVKKIWRTFDQLELPAEFSDLLSCKFDIEKSLNREDWDTWNWALSEAVDTVCWSMSSDRFQI